MRWSWKIGRVFGIDLHVHFTFFLLLAWIAFTYYSQTQDWGATLSGVMYLLLLFVIVVLHELGHALAARRYGIPTKDITLLPIGGVARLARMPEDPKQELVIALAGPAVNVVLAAGLALICFAEGLAGVDTCLGPHGGLLERLFWTNVSLAVFNMIPAFPMDGGRVLRALLAFRMDYVRATQIASSIGQKLALILGLVGVFFNPILAIIALFVWMAAANEAGMVSFRAVAAGIPMRQIMITNFHTVTPEESLGGAASLVMAGFQQDFPVVEHGRLAGILTRGDLIRGMSEQGMNRHVRDVMNADVATAGPHEMLDAVLSRSPEGFDTLVVVHHDQPIGLVMAEQLKELLLVQQAMRTGRRVV
jgi:Zn-dependent protease/CBS domain-containing protein